MDLSLAGFTKYPKAAALAPVIEQAAAQVGMTASLVMGVCAVESQFNPKAYRAEPAINDASRGLMQILLGTARGVGFTGKPDDLYDPATNVRYGSIFLRDCIRSKNGDVWAGVSKYNNGSGNRATKDTRTCLWRNADKSCGQWLDVKAGQFLNWTYVEKVQAAARLFGYVGSPPTTAGPSGKAGVVLVLGIGLALAKSKGLL